AVLVDGEVVDGSEQRLAQRLTDLVADPGPTTVEEGADLLGRRRAGDAAGRRGVVSHVVPFAQRMIEGDVPRSGDEMHRTCRRAAVRPEGLTTARGTALGSEGRSRAVRRWHQAGAFAAVAAGCRHRLLRGHRCYRSGRRDLDRRYRWCAARAAS